METVPISTLLNAMYRPIKREKKIDPIELLHSRPTQIVQLRSIYFQLFGHYIANVQKPLAGPDQ